MRQDAVFSNGEPVTAEDVRFSIDRLMEINAPPADLANTIASVEVVDDRTVRLYLTQSDLAIVAKLADTAFSVLDAEAVLANGGSTDKSEIWLNANSAGSGPYILEGRVSREDIWLVRNEYFPDDPERMERIVVRIVLDTDVRAHYLERDNVDVALDLTKELVGFPTITVVSEPTPVLVYLEANRNPDIGGIVSDERVQSAIRLALDYERIRELVGAVTTPPSFLPRGLPGAIDNEFFQDVERAKEILREGGYDCPSNCEKIPLVYPRDFPFYSQLAEKVSADLATIGLTIDLQPMDSQTWSQGNHPLSLSVMGPVYLDASAYLDFLPGGSIAERINWQDADMETLRNEILTSSDPAQRNDMFMNAQTIVNDRGPYAFLVQWPVFTGVNPIVQGYKYNPQYTVRLAKLAKKCKCDTVASICSNDCTKQICKKCKNQCANVSSC